MSEISFSPQVLPNRAVLRVTGDGALAFLHNILTCDVAALQPGQAAYGALLSPQGKILHDVFVMASTDGALIDCAAAQAEDLLQKLTTYRLRAKLNLTQDEALQVAVSPDFLPDGFVDPRLANIGFRAFRPAGLTPAGTGYDEARLRLGLADSKDIGSNNAFPHEANFDQFGGVSFAKGCYIGQEVVSRMQHRGTARNRMLPIQCSPSAPEQGASITSDDTVVGQVLSAAGSRALALLRLDRLAEAQAPLLSGSVAIRVLKPGWVKYDVAIPEAAQ